MNQEDRWLLPEGIDEVLPPTAWQLEQLRRRLLDLYASWGYELVQPPLIEFLESLLLGAGDDLDLQTFKLIDQLSGRMLGVRADMTPQVARIDGHGLHRQAPTRLCYIGTTLQTRSDGFGGSRSPLQVGAELYGHAGIASDCEILALMLESLQQAGIQQAHLDLGHVGIFRGLVQQAELAPAQEALLFDILQRKALPELDQLLAGLTLRPALAAMLRVLADLNGDEAVLGRAEAELASANESVQQALATLVQLNQALKQKYPKLPIHFDLAELRGYRYHSGVVFAAYLPGQGQEIARGGRYDKTGQVFGRNRPATGFSADLKTLLRVGNDTPTATAAILAPYQTDPALKACIDALRQTGERVIQVLPDSTAEAAELGCDRSLQKHAGTWVIKPL